MTDRIDPLFQNESLVKHTPVTASAPVVASQLVSASERPPLSPTSKLPMTLVEGAYKGRTFKMWCDLTNRLSVPVRKS